MNEKIKVSELEWGRRVDRRLEVRMHVREVSALLVLAHAARALAQSDSTDNWMRLDAALRALDFTEAPVSVAEARES